MLTTQLDWTKNVCNCNNVTGNSNELQSNLPKWIPLKWITCLNGYHFSHPVYIHNVKYKTWISGYTA